MNRPLCLSLLLIFFAFHSAYSQQPDYRACDTDIRWRDAVSLDPSAERRNAIIRASRKNLDLLRNSRHTVTADGSVLYRIPVVFHIIHNYGNENISKAQVLDAVDILNKSFQKLNPDTGMVIPLFQPIFADCQIEFVLPSLDPNGGCTDGITRTSSTFTNAADDNVKSLVGWPSDRYLNIWVVKNIESGAAGYAYYPGISASIDGIVIRHDYMGSIGTSSGSNYAARSLTHEVGHWLNLPHTWGSTNFPGVASNCNTDDGIADTPNTIGVDNFSCNTAQSTCGFIDNVQNYMDYSSCHYMFTEGQKAEMHSTLNSSVGNRDLLSTTVNWQQTGTMPGQPVPGCGPVADFKNTRRSVCAGTSVAFRDISWNGSVTSRQWQFPGGVPATDTAENPLINYPVPGLYNVTLSVSNGNGSDVITRAGIVEVLPTPGLLSVPFSESFETMSFPGDWTYENPDNNNPFSVSSAAASSGTKSLRLNNNNANGPGSVDAVLTPSIDFSNATGSILTFRYAYAARNNSDSSQLRVLCSVNCGDTWFPRLVRRDAGLRTAPNTNANFIPTSSEWATQSVNLSSLLISGKPAVRIKFEFTNVNANNFYIDDVNISPATGVNEQISGRFSFEAFPNPSRGMMQISLETMEPSLLVLELTDVSGRRISYKSFEHVNGSFRHELDGNGLNGIYVLNVSVNGQRFAKRVSFHP